MVGEPAYRRGRGIPGGIPRQETEERQARGGGAH